MELIEKVITAVIIVLIIFLIIRYATSSSSIISKCALGTTSKTISSKDLENLGFDQGGSNYSYSIWFYVSNWSDQLNKNKTLLVREGSGGMDANPNIYLTPYENNINITVMSNPLSGTDPTNITNTCTVKNFPLQAWVHLMVSMSDRVMDIYLDGKLVRTCIIKTPPVQNINAPLYITPNGGFTGWTSNIQYWPTAYNPQEVFNIYAQGPKCQLVGQSFDKYKLRISYLVNNQEQNYVEI